MLIYIENLDIQNCILSPLPSKSVCMKVVKENLLQLDSHYWENKIANNGTDENNGNKLRTYRTYKDTFCNE